jgi:hypothetical protein
MQNISSNKHLQASGPGISNDHAVADKEDDITSEGIKMGKTIFSAYNFSPFSEYYADDQKFIAQPYTQVFSEKFGFVSDLSILDLLFNEGSSAYSVLMNCFQK